FSFFRVHLMLAVCRQLNDFCRRWQAAGHRLLPWALAAGTQIGAARPNFRLQMEVHGHLMLVMPQQIKETVRTLPQAASEEEHHKVVVIGSGFGATMTGLSIARALKARNKSEDVLMLERGTWWTTPVSTVQDKEVATFKFLKETHMQPVQHWASQNHFTGFIDLATRCLRHPWNKDGLYDITRLGTHGFWSLFHRENDGVTITRANGVGGG